MKQKLFIFILFFVLLGSACDQPSEDGGTAVSNPPLTNSEMVPNEGNGRMVSGATMSESMSDGGSQMSSVESEESSGGLLSILERTAVDSITIGDITVLNDDSRQAKEAVLIFANHDTIPNFLAGYPNWVAEVWDEGELVFGINLLDGETQEWLGWGQIDLSDESIVDLYVPMDLPPEQFQAGRDRVEAFIFEDAEILARLGDVSLWGYDTYYNKWDSTFETYFYKGIEELLVVTVIDEQNDELYINAIKDPSALTEAQTVNEAQDRAITIAYDAENVWDFIGEVDDWSTYVTPVEENQWLVEFVTTDARLFYALVDLSSEQIIESGS
ncbi:MAG: hypothetical protein AAF490_28770 [Chloroflexota bacterium]